MRRVLLSTFAVIIANVAALFLFWLTTSAAIVLFDARPWLDIFLDGLFLVGFFGSVIVGTTIFPVSLALAYIGLLLHWVKRWICVGGGALIGTAFTLYGYQGVPLSGVDQRNALLFIGIGAICGWIYWRIAISRPEQSA